MKAITIQSPGIIEVVSLERPQMAEDEILLKIKYVGFCGSDLSTYLGKNPLVQYPRIPGHEISAIIENTGKKVPPNFKKGQKVTVVPYSNCGQCSSCKQKRFNACRYNQTLGVQRDGAMAEYISIHWSKVLLAEGLNERQLALVEPLTVGFHAVDNARVNDSDMVMVLGCGMIGTGAIIRSVLRGAEIIAVDIDDNKLELAKKLGATQTINSKTQNLHTKLEEITKGNGPSVIIEAAGNPLTYKAAIDEVAFAGRVVCIGYTSTDVSFQTKLWVQKELTIMGSRNANPSDFDAVIKYLQKAKEVETLLITKIITPDQANDSVKHWSENPGEILKILVEF